MAIGNEKEIVVFNRKLGPTIDGKKTLLSLGPLEKFAIIKKIRKEWYKLIDLHFEFEASIQSGRTIDWKDLSEKHLRYKKLHGFSTNILEMSEPSLAQRYKNSIRYDIKKFGITIEYPDLVYGRRGGVVIDARIHQIGLPDRLTKGGKLNGMPKRPITLSGFTTIAKRELLKELTGNAK